MCYKLCSRFMAEFFVGGSGGKVPEKRKFFYIWRAKGQLKLKEISEDNLS